jgi:UDP-N-acetylglucosamine 2-epimerase
VTGNTVIDALKTTVKENYDFPSRTLRNLDIKNKRIVTVTAHRRENLGDPLRNICSAIREIALNYSDTEIVYPVHLNPAVQEVVYEILGSVNNVHLIDPIDVACMHNLMNQSYLILTDSGGLQEEAPSLGKPVLVLRNETERPEAVKSRNGKSDWDKVERKLLSRHPSYWIILKNMKKWQEPLILMGMVLHQKELSKFCCTSLASKKWILKNLTLYRGRMDEDVRHTAN